MPFSKGGSSAAPSSAQGQYTGNDVSINNNASAVLTFDTLSSGTAQLNISVPGSPTIVTAGVYAISAYVRGTSLSVAGNFRANLALGLGVIQAYAAPASAAVPTVDMGLTLVSVCAAGSPVAITVLSEDGSSARNFKIVLAVVQRIS